MHIFCSVQYDLYFLFNVKLLTTHSTDVAATSVNSKNKFCPFAKELLHYFSNIKKYRESQERKVNFRSSVYGSSRACHCWPLNFFLVIDKGKDDIFTLSLLSLLLCSSSSLSLSCKDSLSAPSLFLSRVCSINGSCQLYMNLNILRDPPLPSVFLGGPPFKPFFLACHPPPPQIPSAPPTS